MVGAAGAEECRRRSYPLRDFEPEHVGVKGERALEISDLQVDVTDLDARIDGPFHSVIIAQLWPLAKGRQLS